MEMPDARAVACWRACWIMLMVVAWALPGLGPGAAAAGAPPEGWWLVLVDDDAFAMAAAAMAARSCDC